MSRLINNICWLGTWHGPSKKDFLGVYNDEKSPTKKRSGLCEVTDTSCLFQKDLTAQYGYVWRKWDETKHILIPTTLGITVRIEGRPLIKIPFAHLYIYASLNLLARFYFVVLFMRELLYI